MKIATIDRIICPKIASIKQLTVQTPRPNMKKVLRITTSILGEGSVSSLLMDELLVKLSAQEQFKITERNFAHQAIPHLDGEWLQAIGRAHV